MRFALTKYGSGCFAFGGILLGLVQVKDEINRVEPLPDSAFTTALLAGLVLIAVGLVAVIVDHMRFMERIRANTEWLMQRMAAIMARGDFDCTPAKSDKDLQSIYKFADRELGGGISPLELMRAWHAKNPEVMWMLMSQRAFGNGTYTQLVGCFSIMPISRPAARLVKQAKLFGNALQANHILKPNAKLVSGIYIGGVAAVGKRARAFILGYMMKEVLRYASLGIPVYARPVTTEGLKMLERFFFVPVKPGERGLHKIYVLDYSALAAAREGKPASRRSRQSEEMKTAAAHP